MYLFRLKSFRTMLHVLTLGTASDITALAAIPDI